MCSVLLLCNFIIQKPWQKDASLPVEAAEMYFLIGMCHTEMRDYLSAHDAFNNAIRVDSRHSEVCMKVVQ